MTLKAIADELGTTTMTIYRRLERSGLTIKELRDDETGEITMDGVGIIASLFKNTTTTENNEAAQQLLTDVLNSNRTGATGSTDNTTAAQVAALTATVDGLNRLVEQLESERDELRRQLAQVTAALQSEQLDRQHERQLLTAGVGGDGDGDGVHDRRRRWRWPWSR